MNNINLDEVKDIVDCLKYAYGAIENLHAKFMVHRDHAKDDKEEDDLVVADENYMVEVDKNTEKE